LGIVLAFKEKDVRGRAPPENADGDDSVEWDLELPSDSDVDLADALDDELDALLGMDPAGGFGAGDD